jgi:hypothetical protein
MKQVVVLTPTPFSNAQSTMGSQPASDFSNFLIIASIFSAVSIIAIFLLLFRRHGRSAPYSFI